MRRVLLKMTLLLILLDMEVYVFLLPTKCGVVTLVLGSTPIPALERLPRVQFRYLPELPTTLQSLPFVILAPIKIVHQIACILLVLLVEIAKPPEFIVVQVHSLCFPASDNNNYHRRIPLQYQPSPLFGLSDGYEGAKLSLTGTIWDTVSWR